MNSQDIIEHQNILDGIFWEIYPKVGHKIVKYDIHLLMHNTTYMIRIRFKKRLFVSDWIASLSDPELIDKLICYINKYEPTSSPLKTKYKSTSSPLRNT